MSLRGRYVIDRIKRAVSHRLTLPCPPYGSPDYWDGVYKKLGPDDVFEWGGITLQDDLLKHRFNRTLYQGNAANYGFMGGNVADDENSEGQVEDDSNWSETTFGEAIGVHPSEPNKRVLLLGCGNSQLGEDMLSHGWTGPLVQVDFCSRVLSTMSARCAPQLSSGAMEFVQDDATQLTAFRDGTVDAAVDKGLVDALFCATGPEQMRGVMQSVHRVLRPGGVFVFFSFSRPEFILGETLGGEERVRMRMWHDVQVRALDSILMYRYEKNHWVKGKRRREGGGHSTART